MRKIFLVAVFFVSLLFSASPKWQKISGASILIPTSGLKANYKCEGSANSSTGNYNGIPSNITYGIATSKLGTACTFSGVNSYITINPSPSMSSFTIAFWINPSQTQTALTNAIGYRATQSSSWWQFYMPNTSGTQIRFAANGSDKFIFSIQQNGWTHIAVAIDSLGMATAFLNGSHIGNATGCLVTEINPLIIGKYDNSSVGYVGKLDSIYIYDRQLSPEEVQAIYSAEAAQ